MHQCDLPIDEPTHENGVGLPHRSGDLEDVSTLWVSPPTSSNRFADDGRDE
jgi:hypothetical protein